MQLMSKCISLFFIILKYCQTSFEDIELWYKELKENANPDIKLILVGNKIDLNDFKVDKEDIKNLKEEFEIDLEFEVSAKTGENVEKLFVDSTKLLYNEYLNIKNNKKKNGNKLMLEETRKEIELKKGNACIC